MLYEELHNHYGTHVAQRLRRELTPSEFNGIEVEDLPQWLEQRAEEAHDIYRTLLIKQEKISDPHTSRETIWEVEDALQRWREAEDLSYLVTIAEDVSAHHGARAVQH